MHSIRPTEARLYRRYSLRPVPVMPGTVVAIPTAIALRVI